MEFLKESLGEFSKESLVQFLEANRGEILVETSDVILVGITGGIHMESFVEFKRNP